MGKATNTVEKKAARVEVNADHTVEDVLALEAKGVQMVFTYEKDFRDLSDEAVAELSAANKQQYFIAFGAHRAWMKQKSAAGPTEGLEIKDPLQGKAPNKLRVLRRVSNGSLVDVSAGWTDAKGVAWHPCWKRPDEKGEVEELGYTLVTQESDPDIITRGASAAGTSRVIRRKDGSDDLILYKVPQRLFSEHMQAVALESSKHEGAALRDLKAQLREANRQIELEDTTEEITATIDRNGEHIQERTG